MTAARAMILDYGCGNTYNLAKMLRSLGVALAGPAAPAADPRPEDLLVLPGVGHFGHALATMTGNGQRERLLSHVARGGRVLAICLGMQLLCTASEEAPGTAGLGIFNGRVRCLRRLCGQPAAVVPNVGFREVTRCNGSGLLDDRAEFYFDHSFAPALDGDPAALVASATFQGVPFAAVIRKHNVTGVQFHPELSGDRGRSFLRRVLET